MKIKQKVVITLMALCFSWSALAEPKKLIFSHVVGSDTPKGRMALMFKKIVEEKLPGEYEVIIYENASLMSDVEAVDAVSEGKIHFAAPALSKFTKYTSKLKVFDLPFMFPDISSVEQFQNGPVGKTLLTSMVEENILGLGYLHNGLKQLTATKKFSSPEDLEGLRFRIINTDVLNDQFLAIGAKPIPIPWPETYQAIEENRVDGQENTWSNIYSSGFYKHHSYMMASNHGLLGYMLITNDEFWNGLKSNERRLIKYAMNMALRYGNAVATAKSINDKAALSRMRNVELVEPTQKQLVAWRKIMEPIWRKYEPVIGKSIIESARGISIAN